MAPRKQIERAMKMLNRDGKRFYVSAPDGFVNEDPVTLAKAERLARATARKEQVPVDVVELHTTFRPATRVTAVRYTDPKLTGKSK